MEQNDIMLPVIGSFTSAIPGEPVAIALINNSAGSIKSLPGAPVTLGVSLCAQHAIGAEYASPEWYRTRGQRFDIIRVNQSGRVIAT